MPLNTLLKKTKVQTFSGRAARLASSLFILTVWTKVTDLSVLIATTCKRKTKVSSYHSVETNKSIMLHVYSPRNDPDPEMIPKELGNGN